MTEYTSPYNSWGDIKLNSAYPILEGYKDYLSVGVRLDFRNPLRFNGFDIAASYTPAPSLPTNERMHLTVNSHLWSWTLSATYNGASFYDLFGPTKFSRKGYSLGLEYSDFLIYDSPRTMEWDFKVASYGGLEKMPDFQNIDATYTSFLMAGVGLRYNFVKFYFGGFGNNWIDYQTEKRYREYYSFPGVDLNAVGGRNYAKALLEWTLPPITFRRFGFLSLYCNWARVALFASGIATDFDSRTLGNIGAQIDFRVVLFSLLNSTFSVAYARAYEKGFGPKNEFMISLKIL